mgnify:CR=1 FL=1
MTIGIIKETHPHEDRVALIPIHAETLIKKGFSVLFEHGAGLAAGYVDDAYRQRGVTLLPNVERVIQEADVIVVVRGGANHLHGHQLAKTLKPKQIFIGMLEPYLPHPSFDTFIQSQISAFSLELLPRTTRAQSMDVLSSMANLAGYKAVITGAQHCKKIFPMMMTAAGTIVPAKILILGVGVAGLQAIATAKRLGAVVSAYDVRKEVKEQVESLGAKFVELPLEAIQAEGGYAKAMDQAYLEKQQALLLEVVKDHDLVITTANIPGKKAPLIITEEMVLSMKPGSIICDLATSQGGNVAFSEKDKIVEKNGVKIIGYSNYASRTAYSASGLLAKNIINFLSLLIDKETKSLKIDFEDEIIKGVRI